MAITSLLEERVFQPEEAARLVAAYERALAQLNLTNRDDPVTELIAKKIVELSATCDGGPEAICSIALQNLGVQVRE